MPDGKTPHRTNARATILDDPDAWFGFEQEYFLYKGGVPLGFPKGGGFPPPQGKYNGAQRIAYTAIILMGLGSLLTGLAIYKPVQFSWLVALFGGYPMARWFHFWLTVGYVAFFLVHVGQVIKSFSTEDAPVTIGVIFDLSGSMNSKFQRARKALSEFLRTSNPQDEFFVVGFNDRPAVIVDYTSDVDDVEARMVMLKPENRTALIDAIYLGVDKLKQAKYERKAILIISDGGDNRSRYTEGELRRVVRESDVQIYSIGIFDQYAPTTEEQLGPILLNDICEMTGGRMFRVLDINDLGDIASRISAELRNEYVIGYRPSQVKQDGNWRKLKIRLVPPPGLPTLTVHNRQGYYAPSQ